MKIATYLINIPGISFVTADDYKPLDAEVDNFAWHESLHIMWCDLQGDEWVGVVRAAFTIGLVSLIFVDLSSKGLMLVDYDVLRNFNSVMMSIVPRSIVRYHYESGVPFQLEKWDRLDVQNNLFQLGHHTDPFDFLALIFSATEGCDAKCMQALRRMADDGDSRAIRLLDRSADPFYEPSESEVSDGSLFD